MTRRELITSLAGMAVAWPVVGRTQQPEKVPTIGFLGAGTASAYKEWVAGFVQRLRELNRVDGRNVAMEFRWADGRTERYPEIVEEFVRINVGVIVVVGTPATLAVKRATSQVPIIFVAVSDPVGTGLVAGLGHPGGNATGLANQQSDLAGKRLQLLQEFVPGLRRLAILANVDNPASILEIGDVQIAARTLGLDVALVEVRRAEQIAPGIETLRGRADALYVASDPLLNSDRVRINTLALDLQLPTLHGFREYVEAAGLVSYGPNFLDLFRRAAEYVDKVLRGAKPSDLPVEQPTKFDLVIKMKTAKALGLILPPTLLARADEVIE